MRLIVGKKYKLTTGETVECVREKAGVFWLYGEYHHIGVVERPFNESGYFIGRPPVVGNVIGEAS